MVEPRGLSARQRLVKRGFDVIVASVLLVTTAPVLAAAVAASRLSTGASGIYRQQRVGKDGVLFEVCKVRTMHPSSDTNTVTTAGDARITRTGAFLRKVKVDELPQLFNVLAGEMSLVGPRPDVPGYADQLIGEDRVVLSVRPGITSPASVAFRHEESLLAAAADPDAYNRQVIWPEKVRLNREYVENWSLMVDLRCLLRTLRTVVTTEGGAPP